MFDLLRILDFYFLFPHLLGSVTLARNMTRQKHAFAERSSKHNRVPSPKLLIRADAGNLRRHVIRALMADGLVSPEPFELQIVQRSETPIPPALEAVFASQPEDERALATFLATELATMPLNGPNGRSKTGRACWSIVMIPIHRYSGSRRWLSVRAGNPSTTNPSILASTSFEVRTAPENLPSRT